LSELTASVSRDPHMTSFDQILHFLSLEFLSLELTAFRLRAKFEVASFNGSGDIRGVPKVDHLTAACTILT